GETVVLRLRGEDAVSGVRGGGRAQRRVEHEQRLGRVALHDRAVHVVALHAFARDDKLVVHLPQRCRVHVADALLAFADNGVSFVDHRGYPELGRRRGRGLGVVVLLIARRGAEQRGDRRTASAGGRHERVIVAGQLHDVWLGQGGFGGNESVLE